MAGHTLRALPFILGGWTLVFFVAQAVGRRWYSFRDFESYPEQCLHFCYWLAHGLRYRYPDPRIKRIVLLPSGHFFVLDRQGNRMLDYAGSVQDKKVSLRIEAARGRVPILVLSGSPSPLKKERRKDIQ